MPCFPSRLVPPYCHPAARAQSGFSLREAAFWDVQKEAKRTPSTARPLSRGPWALIGLPVSVWTGACYWHGVGGSMFNSSPPRPWLVEALCAVREQNASHNRERIPGFAWLSAKNKPNDFFRANARKTTKQKKQKAQKHPPKSTKTPKNTKKTPIFFSRLRAEKKRKKEKTFRAYARKNNHFPGLAQISPKRRNSLPSLYTVASFREGKITKRS